MSERIQREVIFNRMPGNYWNLKANLVEISNYEVTEYIEISVYCKCS